MRTLITSFFLIATLTAPGCARGGEDDPLDLETGRDVTLNTSEGVTVSGRLVEVRPEHVIVEQQDGARKSVARREITSVSAATPRKTPAPSGDRPATPGAGSGAAGEAADRTVDTTPDRYAGPVEDPAPAPATRRAGHRSVTVPSGTLLPVELSSAIASDSSRVEDPVRGTLRRALVVDGVQVLPAGTRVLGVVTSVERAARVKGRARVAFRFTAIEPPGDAGRIAIRTEPVSRLAPATKKQDAAKIGGAAAGGAIVGGILGGGDGAAKGAAIGGAAGTGVVLSTRGAEIRLGPGTPVAVRLAAPLTFQVRAGN